MSLPLVSVVMGVYNGADQLQKTLDSVLAQDGVDLEFIVIDDGSTDATAEILDRCARADTRLRVVHQPNGGLTAALIRGCREARGEFIARQDAGGDVSLPGRLRTQVALLRARPDAVLASCATRFVTHEGELLFDAVISQERLEAGLRELTLARVTGPSSHPSCLFRRDAYERVGGYRRAFTLAQDLDLWLRMVEIGRFIAMDQVFYEACWAFGGLTSRLRPEQARYAELALAGARSRRSGQPEPPLPQPTRSAAMRGSMSRNVELSRYHYFVGSCVARHDRQRARKHFWRAVKAHPLHVRAMLRALLP